MLLLVIRFKTILICFKTNAYTHANTYVIKRTISTETIGEGITNTFCNKALEYFQKNKLCKNHISVDKFPNFVNAFERYFECDNRL